jgi:hypothetical protein
MFLRTVVWKSIREQRPIVRGVGEPGARATQCRATRRDSQCSRPLRVEPISDKLMDRLLKACGLPRPSPSGVRFGHRSPGAETVDMMDNAAALPTAAQADAASRCVIEGNDERQGFHMKPIQAVPLRGVHFKCSSKRTLLLLITDFISNIADPSEVHAFTLRKRDRAGGVTAELSATASAGGFAASAVG